MNIPFPKNRAKVVQNRVQTGYEKRHQTDHFLHVHASAQNHHLILPVAVREIDSLRAPNWFGVVKTNYFPKMLGARPADLLRLDPMNGLGSDGVPNQTEEP